MLMEHNKTFLSWFKQGIINDPSSKSLTWLASGLKFDVLCVRKDGFKLEGGEWFKEGFRKLLSQE